MIRIIVLLLTLAVSTVNAQQTVSEQSENGGASTTASESTQDNSADRLHGATTNLMRNMFGGADAMFVDDYYTTFGQNSTSMRLRLDISQIEYHGWDVNAKLKFNLVLPGMAKRARLVMNDDDVDGDDAATAEDEDENDVALRWILSQGEASALSFDLGLRTKSGNLDPFLRFNAGIQYDISNNWYSQTSNRLFYYSKTDWRNDFRQSFNRIITEDMVFRARTRIQYFDENDYNPYIEQKFSLFQTLNRKSAVAYEVLWEKQAVEDSMFDDDEIRGTLKDNYQNVELRLRYRRNVWRDWLYVEVWPSIGWAEEKDWDRVLAALFRLEVTFGGKGKSQLSR